MTWPASDVGTTNVDATGDSPSTARADFLDLFQKFNQLRNHVSVLGQLLLSRATAALMRTDLGAAASGSNTDITSLSAPALGAATATTQAVDNNTTKVATTAYVVAQAASATPAAASGAGVAGTSTRFSRADHAHPLADALGVGQTWTDVKTTPGRALSTTYTNSSGKPILVFATVTINSNQSCTIVVGGVTIAFLSAAFSEFRPATFVVPNGVSYSIAVSGGALNTWYELR